MDSAAHILLFAMLGSITGNLFIIAHYLREIRAALKVRGL